MKKTLKLNPEKLTELATQDLGQVIGASKCESTAGDPTKSPKSQW